MAGENVVQIVVKADNATGEGFDAAKASSEAAAEGMDTYAAATEKATEAQAQFDAAQKEQADAAERVASLQKDEAAGTGELAAAQERLTGASLASADARKKLASAEADVAAKTKIAGDEQVASGLKQDESAGLMAGAGGKVKTAFLGIAVGAGYAIDKAMDWDEQSTALVTGAGELDKNLGMVKKGMLDISTATATSTTQIQSGMYMIESAGYHGAAGLDVLKAAAEGAKVGNADLGTVANGLTTVLTDYKLKSTDAVSATSGLVAIVAAGKTHMSDLASSLSKVLPTASALKVPFDQVGGAMATMTGQGVTARLAATHLNSTLIAMANPSTKAAAAMKQVGLSSTQVATTLTHQGLTAALEQVTEAAGKKFPVGSAGYIAAVDTMLGGSAGLATALQLTGSHLGDLKKNTDSVAKSMKDGGKDVQGWDDVQKDAAFRLEKTKQAAENTATSFGEALMPAVTDILGPLSSFLGFIAQSSAASKILAGVIGGALSLYLGSKLVGAFSEVKSAGETLFGTIGKIGPALSALKNSTILQAAASKIAAAGQWLLNAAMDANPIMLIVLAIVGLVAGFVLLWNKSAAFRDFWKDLWKDIKEGVKDAVDFIKSHWELLLAILTGPIGAATLFIVEHWKQILNGAVSMINSVESFFKALPGKILSAVGDLGRLLWNAGVSVIQGLINGVKSMIGNVLGVVGGIGHDISSAFSSVLHIFSPSQVFMQHGEMIVAGLAQGISSSVPRAVAALNMLAAAMTSAGRAAATGLASGLRSMTGEVTAAVQELGALADQAIRDKMEISSPSRLMYRHGQAIAEGLGTGMLSGKSAVAGAAQHLAGAAASGSSGGAGTTGGGGQITLQIQAGGGGSGLDQLFMQWLKNNVRVSGGDPRMFNKKVSFI